MRTPGASRAAGRIGSQGHSWCDTNLGRLCVTSTKSLSLHRAWLQHPPLRGWAPLQMPLGCAEGVDFQDLLFTARGAHSLRDTQGNACAATSESLLPRNHIPEISPQCQKSLSIQHDTHCSSSAWLRDSRGWAEPLEGFPGILEQDVSAMSSSSGLSLQEELSWGHRAVPAPGACGMHRKAQHAGEGQRAALAGQDKSISGKSESLRCSTGWERWERCPRECSGSPSLSRASRTTPALPGQGGRQERLFLPGSSGS